MQREYKTYNDLEWGEHRLATDAKKLDPHQFPILAENKDAKHATMLFDNGYGISVVKDCPLITGKSNFECAVIGKVPPEDPRQYRLVYDTDITDDVIRMDTPDEITDIMRRIQDLPPANQKDAA